MALKDPVQLGEIQVHHEHPVIKCVLAWQHSPVSYIPFKNCAMHYRNTCLWLR
jgi:hypothetical protein